MCKTDNCFEKIFILLRAIQVGINDHFRTNAKNYGLNTIEFMIMFEIHYNEGISLNELRKMLDLPKSSVSRIVDQLVNKGIVSRIIPLENRRMVKLYINQEFLRSQEVTDLMKELNNLWGNIEPDKAARIISALEELKSMIK